jgi:hypothetical protein
MRLLFASTLLIAGTFYVPVAASANDEPQSEDKLVCKHRKKTGTRFTTKTCKTASEWDRMAEENRRTANEMINKPFISTARGN